MSSVIKVVLQTVSNERIEVTDLHKLLTKSGAQSEVEIVGTTQEISLSRTLKEDLALTDKKKIEATLSRCKGNVSKSAAILGISRETLHNKIRKYGINVQLFRGNKEV